MNLISENNKLLFENNNNKKLFFVLIIIQLFTLIFIPKINVSEIFGTSINIKPEDIIWLITTPLIIGTCKLRNSFISKFFLLIIFYLFLITFFYHSSNIYLLGRFFIYALPIIYLFNFSSKQINLIKKITQSSLYLMVIVSIFQKFTPFPYFHTGVFGLGPVSRPSGFYGNAIEFSLMAIFLFWIAYFCGSLFWSSFLPAFMISIITSSRFTSVICLFIFFSFLISRYKQKIKKLSSLFFILPIILLPIFLIMSDFLPNYLLRNGTSNLDMSLSELISFSLEAVKNIFINLEPLNQIEINTEYCFDFDLDLFIEQSLAMRFSKAIFVISAVLLGPYKYGVGFGNCIGNAADNLYIRLLSDGGIVLFILIILFFIILLINKNLSMLNEWKIFVLSLIFLSFFYDTLYFSRVAPLIFLNISIVMSIVKNKYRIKS